MIMKTFPKQGNQRSLGEVAFGSGLMNKHGLFIQAGRIQFSGYIFSANGLYHNLNILK